jgi:hypothetical protein
MLPALAEMTGTYPPIGCDVVSQTFCLEWSWTTVLLILPFQVVGLQAQATGTQLQISFVMSALGLFCCLLLISTQLSHFKIPLEVLFQAFVLPFPKILPLVGLAMLCRWRFNKCCPDPETTAQPQLRAPGPSSLMGELAQTYMACLHPFFLCWDIYMWLMLTSLFLPVPISSKQQS